MALEPQYNAEGEYIGDFDLETGSWNYSGGGSSAENDVFVGGSAPLTVEGAVSGAELTLIQAQEAALAALAAGNEAAAQAILEAAGMAIEQQEKFFQIATEYLQPFIESGESALPYVSSSFEGARMLLENPQSILDNPAYQFRYDEGIRAVERLHSAAGNLLSGNTLIDLQSRGQQEASQEINNEFVRRNSLFQSALNWAGLGANAAGTLAGLASNTGANIANTLNTQGTSLANIYSGQGAQQAGIITNTASDLANLSLSAALGRESLAQKDTESRRNQTSDYIKAGADIFGNLPWDKWFT